MFTVVVELKKLFDSMISSPMTEITPEQELARLTLISSTNEEQIRRRSTVRGQRPSLGEINGRPVYGPTLPSPLQVMDAQTDVDMTEGPLVSSKTTGNLNRDMAADDSSEATLVDMSIPTPERRDSVMSGFEECDTAGQKRTFSDKENSPPTKTANFHAPKLDSTTEPLTPTSPSRTNQLLRPLSPVKESESGPEDSIPNLEVPPPDRPPPVPPRALPQVEPQPSIQDQLEIGAQQDVTEVIGNVLFQLQCAIKADRIDEKGEQIDTVKRLFYGKQQSNTIDRSAATRFQEAFFSDIKVNVFSQPHDIYEALDGAFEMQDVEVEGATERQYTTISELPPILQIHINRAQFDTTKKTAIKSDHHLQLRETIYMDRYMETKDPDLIQRRQDCWKWKEELAEAQAERKEYDTETSESLRILADAIGQINELDDPDPIPVSPDLQQVLEKGSEECKERLRSKG